MKYRICITTGIVLILVFAGPGVLSWSQDDQPDKAATAGKQSAAAKTGDFRGAIEKITEAYAQSFNAKDADSVAAFWTENGVYVSQPSGAEVSGRESLKQQMTELFKEDAKRSLSLKINSMDLISPSVVLQRGTSIVTTGAGEKLETNFRTIFVHQGGKWLIDRVTEDEAEEPIPSHYEQLKPLEWLVGNWIDQSDDQTVKIETNFTTNRNFMTRAYAVYVDGNAEHSGMEVIGWDSKKQQIRSWLFDSQGGFIESHWTEKKDRWIVQSVATLPGGKTGSYTSVYRPLKDGQYGWQKVNQQIDGQLLPNLDEVIINRESN